MPSSTLAFFGLTFGKLGGFVKSHPTLGIFSIILMITVVSAAFNSFTHNDPTIFKEQVGDRVINADSKTYNDLKQYDQSGIPNTGYFSKYAFILGLIITIWFEIALISFIAWIFENTFEAKVMAYVYAIAIVFMLGFAVNIWNYNFHDDSKLTELSGYSKFKYTVETLNPIKGLISLITHIPNIKTIAIAYT